jgi:nitrate/nitrite transport system permease protein
VVRSPAAGSLVLLLALLAVWHLSTLAGDAPAGPAVDPEYAKLMGGAGAEAGAAGAIPGPAVVAARAATLLSHAFNPDGIGWQLMASLGRVLLGFAIAAGIGVPLGLLIGLLPRLNKVLDPYIQILKPISPLAWMPLALYALKDSTQAAIFIIAISAIWPVLINSAAGAAGVRNEWLNVARVLDLPWHIRVWRIVLPAAVPGVLTGMRISIGTAWFVIVAAEMVVGSSGIGYFIWNQWNNLQIADMLVAVLLIGAVGFMLDQVLAAIGRRLAFRE